MVNPFERESEPQTDHGCEQPLGRASLSSAARCGRSRPTIWSAWSRSRAADVRRLGGDDGPGRSGALLLQLPERDGMMGLCWVRKANWQLVCHRPLDFVAYAGTLQCSVNERVRLGLCFNEIRKGPRVGFETAAALHRYFISAGLRRANDDTATENQCLVPECHGHSLGG